MKALLDLFKQVTHEEEFDAIKIALASPEKSDLGHLAKSRSLKRSTIGHLSQSAMVYFARKFSAQ